MTKEQILKLQDKSIFGKNLYKYVEFCSWCRWFPDLFLDLIKPKTGGITLNPDQRVYLRSILRFVGMYGVFPRGYSKTYMEVLAMYLVSIFYPNIDIGMSAQTKENAAELIGDKHKEILRHFPMLENELIGRQKFSKGEAEVEFKSGARIDNLANAQSTKGQRRKRLNIEEAALLNNVLFEDVLLPVVEVGRSTVGKYGIVDPCELNQQINFFTTSGFRGSDEFVRSLKMVDNMVNLQGEIVLGSSWFLACWYGRGSTKSQILKKKREMSTVAFAQNYESKWVGSSDGALVNINKLLNCRNLTAPMINMNRHDEEFYLGVDIARSQKTSNNQSSIAIGRVIRNKDTNKILNIEVPNIMTVSNTMNFTNQACLIKNVKNNFNAKAVIVDGNGIGAGIVDELLKESYDPMTGVYLGCWDTINTDNKPEIKGAEKCLFDMKAQSYQTKVITNFIDSIDSGKLRLLVKKQDSDFTDKERSNMELNVLPFIQTDFLIEEIANLKLKQNGNALAIEKVVKKVDKDRFSALAYLVFYITEFCSFSRKKNIIDTSKTFNFRPPNPYGN